MPSLYVHHFGGYSKTRYKKLVTHVESHASAMSLLESGEQRYIKVINNYNNTSRCNPAESVTCVTASIIIVQLDVHFGQSSSAYLC